MTVDELIEKLQEFPGDTRINIGTEATYSGNRSRPLFEMEEAFQSSWYLVHPVRTHGHGGQDSRPLGQVLFL